MAYIGRQGVIGNFVKLDNISVVNGQAAYTMQNNSVNFTDYSTVNQFLVSLNGTVQSPGSSFSVSSSTITFSSNLVTGDVIDFIIVFGNSLSAGTPTDGTVTTAKLVDSSVTSAKLSYPLTTFSSTGIDDNATSTAITIDSDEKVGIGTTSPSVKLEIKGTENDADTQAIRLMENTTQGGFIKYDGDANELKLGGYNSGENTGIRIARNDATTYFNTNGSERMRILSGGGVVIAKTSETIDDAGHEFRTNGLAVHTRTSDTVLLINRMGSDGTLQEFEAAGNLEGTISVSGSTVSYNGFTGTHWSRFQNNSTPTILRGTVLETLDKMCDWYNLEFDIITQDDDGNDVTTTEKVPHVLTDTQSNGDTITYNHKGTDYEATIVKETDVKHMMSKVSDTVDAKNVYGVFVAYDLDGEGYNDFYVASVGSYVVRIKSGQTIAKGDLLQSNGDGTAKVQSDDNIKSSSFAKVLSTTVIETYEDGSFIVPCSLMC